MNETGIILNLSNVSASLPVEYVAQTNSLGVAEAFITMFAFFIAIVVCHELGHFYILTKYQPTARINVARKGWLFEVSTGENEDYWVLTPKQRLDVYIAGVLAGFVPLLIFIMLHQFYWLLCAPYILGLTSDFQNIVRAIKQMNRTDKKKKEVQPSVSQ